MIRAKRYTDAKMQAQSNPELVWWVFMRMSGLILIFLVLGHIYMTFIQQSEIVSGEASTIVEKLKNPVWKFYDWLILVLAGLHGLNGARYSIEDYIQSRQARLWTKVLLYTLSGILFLWGTVVLFTFF